MSQRSLCIARSWIFMALAERQAVFRQRQLTPARYFQFCCNAAEFQPEIALPSPPDELHGCRAASACSACAAAAPWRPYAASPARFLRFGVFASAAF